ncbi:bacteriophage-like protein [Rhizobium sp. PDO1-076]|uniref:head decoration protein n=1 Tax=Rhizobium sp. PDO1-076 TaxID=1125979 RepID=UPI00024E372D|nr:head decoration protein [Rhizobium sp. PDO1-076]EHS53426.1 bacteriophage-like protein [Rhizobium sp. PDO1-076]
MRTLNLTLVSDIVKYEADSSYSRDEDTLASGSGVVLSGTVLGKVASTRKFKPLAPAAADGTEKAAAIILQRSDATSADQTVVNLKRHAKVVLQSLKWPAGITAEQRAAALDQLEALGLVARNGA